MTAAPPVGRGDPAVTGRPGRAEVDDAPCLRDGTVVHPPADEGGPWVVRGSGGRYFRVGGDLAALLRELDGTRTPAQLAQDLGPPWSEPTVRQVLIRLSAQGLLADGTARRAARGWFVYRPPLTFQLTLVRPGRVLAWFAPLLRVLWRPATAVVLAAVVVGGVLALVGQGDELYAVAVEPLPVGLIVGVLLASQVVTALHELGHGLVLVHHGGRPARMGVMLFYLVPAFFCDVSDGWRLPRRSQRVQVALAGPATQCLIAGSSALAALVVTDADLRRGLLVLSIGMYVAGVANLVPLVKLDGYLALMAHHDLPHLRARAMRDAAGAIAAFLFGVPRPPREVPRRWSVPYGLACMAFPVYLLAIAFSLWSDVLASMGRLALAVVALVAGLLAFRGVRALVPFVRRVRRAGASIARLVGVPLVGALLVGLAGWWIEVPYVVHGRFVVREDGSSLFLVADDASLGLVDAGTPVVLSRRGPLLGEDRGTATVAPGEAVAAQVPSAAWLTEPGPGDEALRLPVTGLPLEVDVDPGLTAGAARAQTGEVPVLTWLYRRYLAPLLAW